MVSRHAWPICNVSFFCPFVACKPTKFRQIYADHSHEQIHLPQKIAHHIFRNYENDVYTNSNNCPALTNSPWILKDG